MVSRYYASLLLATITGDRSGGTRRGHTEFPELLWNSRSRTVSKLTRNDHRKAARETTPYNRRTRRTTQLANRQGEPTGPTGFWRTWKMPAVPGKITVGAATGRVRAAMKILGETRSPSPINRRPGTSLRRQTTNHRSTTTLIRSSRIRELDLEAKRCPWLSSCIDQTPQREGGV